jgi:CYTH domain-containing protein
MEIERKWVAPEVPAGVGRDLSGTAMRQGYLAIDGDVTVRLRLTEDGARLTVKAGRSAARTEVEVDLPTADADELWPYTEGRRLVKTRYRLALPHDGLVAEVDVFDGALAGLCLVEVEFGSEAAARAFEPPSWFGREVTAVPGWSNAELARAGRPPDR